MTLAEMIVSARELLGETDSSNTHYTDAQLTTWANEFYRRVVSKFGSTPIKERTYTTPTGASPTITLNSGTISINQVKLYEQTSGEWRELKVIDIEDLIRMDPDWENATVNVPTHFVRFGPFSARLYPPPNAANASQANSLKTYGLEVPTSLSASSDTPDLPSPIHDIFPHYMAYRGFSQINSERAVSELVLVNTMVKEMRQTGTEWSKKRGWTWHSTDPESGIDD